MLEMIYTEALENIISGDAIWISPDRPSGGESAGDYLGITLCCLLRSV